MSAGREKKSKTEGVEGNRESSTRRKRRRSRDGKRKT